MQIMQMQAGLGSQAGLEPEPTTAEAEGETRQVPLHEMGV